MMEEREEIAPSLKVEDRLRNLKGFLAQQRTLE